MQQSFFHYLTVFPVKQLKALYVLEFNPLRQSLSLEIDIRKLWESSGSIWTKTRRNLGTDCLQFKL